MDFVRKVYKPAVKIHKRVKLGKLCKKLKPAAKLFKMLFNMFSSTPLRGGRRPPLPSRDDHDSLTFMTCIIKVNASKPGWQKAVLSLVKNCQGARFKMDVNGVVEVSGIADPNKLLKKIGKSRRVELQWFQFGQCSNNLFMPPPTKPADQTKKKTPNPIPDPTQLHYDQYQYNDQYYHHDPLQYYSHGYPQPLFNFNRPPMPIGYY